MRSFFILLFMMLPVLVTQAQNNDVFDLSLEQLTRVRITSATLSEQRVQDAPGAISVITRQDIERMGFRTLRDVFATIPGFQMVQNDDEVIVAVRGVYPTTNQKILVMRDGNPMNESVLDRFEPGYISLESVKKIEIIRGPSASLYGNSATTAVVNIITEDETKTRVRVDGGTYGYLNVDGVYSRKIQDKGHLLLYGRLANARGERVERLKSEDNLNRSVRDGYSIVENYPWNYDAGFRLQLGIVTVASSVRHHHQNVYWGSIGQVVRADSLLAQPEMKGIGINNEVVIVPRFKRETWKARVQLYCNYGHLNVTKAVSPDSGFASNVFYPDGRLINFSWNGLRTGVTGYASYEYAKNGTLLLGAQLEQRSYLKSSYATNYLGSGTPGEVISPGTMVQNDSLIPPGNEMRNAVYAQLQHSFLEKKLLLNVGARLDIPENFAPTFNPRVALVYTPIPKVVLKAVFAQGFQAPGYLYRSSVPALGYGSTDNLHSEILHSAQMIGRYTFGKQGYVEVVGFQNQLSNLVTRNGPLYENLGTITIRGIEADTRIDFKSFALFGNLTLMVPDSGATDSLYRTRDIKDGKLKHQSGVTATLGGILRPGARFNFTLYGQYFSGFYTGTYGAEVRNPSRVIINGTLIYRNIFNKIDISATCYNFLNKRYFLSDRDTALLPQQGLWAQLGIAIDLK